MQPDSEQNDEWKQPSEVRSQAPFQVVPEPDTIEQQSLGQENTPYTLEPNFVDETNDIQDDAEFEDGPDTPLDAEPFVSEDDQVLIRWEALEYTDHKKSQGWYIIFGVITLALVLVAIFLIHSVTFAVLLPVMALALFIYTRRTPEVLHYTLSKKGLYTNDKLYPYAMFKSFGVVNNAEGHSIVLVPRKRFQISQTMYFSEDIGERLVDMLASRLPMKEISPDAIDRLLAKLHL